MGEGESADAHDAGCRSTGASCPDDWVGGLGARKKLLRDDLPLVPLVPRGCKTHPRQELSVIHSDVAVRTSMRRQMPVTFKINRLRLH